MEIWNEILVAEFRLRPISSRVVLEFFRAFEIHVSRIPLAAKCRHRIKPPMDKDSKLRVFIPAWNLVFLERIPSGLERTLLAFTIHLSQNRVPFRIEFLHGLLPHEVVRIGSLTEGNAKGGQREQGFKSHLRRSYTTESYR